MKTRDEFIKSVREKSEIAMAEKEAAQADKKIKKKRIISWSATAAACLVIAVSAGSIGSLGSMVNKGSDVFMPEQYELNYIVKSININIANKSEKENSIVFDRLYNRSFSYLDPCKLLVRDYYERTGRQYNEYTEERMRADINYLKEWNGYRDMIMKHTRREKGVLKYTFDVFDPFYHCGVKFTLSGKELHELYLKFGFFSNVLTDFINFSHVSWDASSIPRSCSTLLLRRFPSRELRTHML